MGSRLGRGFLTILKSTTFFQVFFNDFIRFYSRLLNFFSSDKIAEKAFEMVQVLSLAPEKTGIVNTRFFVYDFHEHL